MKKLLFISLVTTLGFVLSYCGPDPAPEPTPSELQLEKLAGAYNQSGSRTWTVNEVTFQGSEDRTTEWKTTDFRLTFTTSGTLTGNTYSTSGVVTPGPWPLSGSWSFGGTAENPNINQVLRNDGLEISVSVSETTLSLTFTFDESVHTGGRVEALSGEYVFTFTAN